MKLLHHRKVRMRDASRIAKEILLEAEKRSIDQVWVVLESPCVFKVARILAAHKLPMVATVWDPPDGICRQFGMDRYSRKIATNDFDLAASACSRIGVISEPMAHDFQAKYPHSETAVMRFVPESLPKPVTRTAENSELTIAFAGSIYASQEFQTLLSALDTVDWKIGERPVRVKVLGAKFRFVTSKPCCIEFLGYRSQANVTQIMSQADCGYVPYWFADEYKASVALCFPSKLVTCVSARTPVFFHGPKVSSPASFLNRYQIGTCCHSLDHNDIVSALERISKLDRNAVAAECVRATSEELNLENFRNRFRWLLTAETVN